MSSVNATLLITLPARCNEEGNEYLDCHPFLTKACFEPLETRGLIAMSSRYAECNEQSIQLKISAQLSFATLLFRGLYGTLLGP